MILELFSILNHRVGALPPTTIEAKQEKVLQEVLSGNREKIKDFEEITKEVLYKKEKARLEEEKRLEEERKQKEIERRKPKYPTSNFLTKFKGVNVFKGHRETYYNLPMNNVIRRMRDFGYSLKDYWIREDGAKMLGDYIMVAANFNKYPRGTKVLTSLGEGIVVDTGGFAQVYPNGFDLATNW